MKVLIENHLKPQKCEFCPCYNEGHISGPSYCGIIALKTKDIFNARPDINKCPLKKNNISSTSNIQVIPNKGAI